MNPECTCHPLDPDCGHAQAAASCPQCGAGILEGATECDCGWTEPTAAEFARAAKDVVDLIEIEGDDAEMKAAWAILDELVTRYYGSER